MTALLTTALQGSEGPFESNHRAEWREFFLPSIQDIVLPIFNELSSSTMMRYAM